MTLHDLIDAGGLVAIDTAPLIYYIEGGSSFDAVAVELFEDCIASGRNRALMTIVTLAEVLVGALRSGRHDLAEAYRDVLQQSAHVVMLDLDPVIAERAADLRARYELWLPDALQVAAALSSGAGYFITDDARLKKVTEIRSSSWQISAGSGRAGRTLNTKAVPSACDPSLTRLPCGRYTKA